MTLYRNRRIWLATLTLALALVFTLFSVLTTPVQAASMYLIPDVLGSPGRYAITINDSNPVLSYFSKNTNKLMVASCGNSVCQTDLTVINSISAEVPQNLAAAIVSGNPFVVYTASNLLRVAACGDALCGQPAVINTIENSAGISLSKVVVTVQNGLPIIAYQVKPSGGSTYMLKLAFCNDSTCTAPIIRTLVTGFVDNNSEIELGLLNGNPIATYTVATTQNLYLVKCLSATCAETPTQKLIDNNVKLANYTGMTVTQDTPIITYMIYESSYISWLTVATCTDSACDGPMYIHKVAQVGSSSSPSVALVNNLPMIAYFSSNETRLATCLDIVCNYSSGTQIADINFIVPEIQSASNSPVISLLNWSDPNNLRLYIYNSGDFHPQHSPTPTATPTITFTPISSPPPAPDFTPSPTLTPSITPTASMTLTPTETFTSLPTNTPTNTPLPTATATATASNIPITPTSVPDAAPPRNYSTNSIRTLTWNRVTLAVGYVLQISPDKNFVPNLTTTVTLPATSLAYTTDSLANGTYYWRVMVVGGTRWSSIETFIVSALPTLQPTP